MFASRRRVIATIVGGSFTVALLTGTPLPIGIAVAIMGLDLGLSNKPYANEMIEMLRAYGREYRLQSVRFLAVVLGAFFTITGFLLVARCIAFE